MIQNVIGTSGIQLTLQKPQILQRGISATVAAGSQLGHGLRRPSSSSVNDSLSRYRVCWGEWMQKKSDPADVKAAMVFV